MTQGFIIRRSPEGYACKHRGNIFHVAKTREEARRACSMYADALTKALLKPILAEMAGEHDPVGFGDPRHEDDYRAWPDPDQARKLRAETSSYSCPWCGRSPCSGHVDCA